MNFIKLQRECISKKEMKNQQNKMRYKMRKKEEDKI